MQKVSTNILLIASLYSDDNRFDETFLSNYAIINLQNPLARLPGVGQVQVLGAGPYSMRIWLDPVKLKAYGLTVLDVQNAIQNQNIQVAAGQLGGPPVPSNQVFQFTVKTLGRLSDVKQFENIIVKAEPPSTLASSDAAAPTRCNQTAAVVRIRDIAKVELSQEVYSTFSGLSGKKAAQMNVYTLPGANALKVAQEVRGLMGEMSHKFPPGLKYVALLDTSTFIKDSIHGVYQALIEAGILVLIVIMLFLQNFRAMLVPATTVPVTIIGAFAAMALLGFSVNLMTLFALILAIGIVVDDAIVIVENASHYIETGLTPKDAAIKAMSELTGPVLGITLVLTSVFLPASFLPGITGQMFRQFALVIASTAVISALNALTLKPTQCALYLRPVPKDKKVNWFYHGFNVGYGAMEDVYVGLVSRMAHHPWLMACVFFAVVGTAGWLFGHHPTAFLPTEDQGYCLVVARLPPGASQPRVREVADGYRWRSQADPGAQGMGDQRRFFGVGFGEPLQRRDRIRDVSGLGQAAAGTSRRTRSSPTSGRRLPAIQRADFSVLIPPPIPGLGTAGGFQMMIEDRGGTGLNELQKGGAGSHPATPTASRTCAASPRPSAPPVPQLDLEINRTMVGVAGGDDQRCLPDPADLSGFDLRQPVQQVQPELPGSRAGARRTTGASCRISPTFTSSNRSGQMVPLGAVLDVRRMLGSELLTRYNLYPAVSIIGGPAPGYSSGQALNTMERHRRAKPAVGNGLRLDRPFLPGEADRQSGLLHFRAVDHAGLPGAGRPVRKLDRSGGGDSDRADGAGRACSPR